MAQSPAQTTSFGVQNWMNNYRSLSDPQLSSYDFETLRKSFIDYLQLYNPENYNDYINSSEYIALIDLIAFMGQSLSFRFDLNARENFLSTAQNRNSINYLAQLVNYQPNRNLAANGYLKIGSISINEPVFDSLGNNLNGLTINWNDRTNRNWQDQWNTIINAILINSQTIGQPGNTNIINGINYSEYALNCPVGQPPPYPFNASVNSTNMNFEIVNPTSAGQNYIYEVDPNDDVDFNLLYENDGLGFASVNTGFFLYFKQGSLTSQTFTITQSLPNNSFTLAATGINNTDVWLYQINQDQSLTEWNYVPAIYGQNTLYNNLPSAEQNVYSITNGVNDTITLVFGDGVFGTIPQGNFICYTRISNGLSYRINPNELSNISISIPYTSKTNRIQQITLNASLLYTVGNSATTESLANIKLKAPQSYYTQNRMVNGQDYNSFPFTQYNNIVQIKAVNRTSSGVSRYLDVIDPTGKYSTTNIFCDDGFLYVDPSIITNNFNYSNQNTLSSIIESQIVSIIAASNTLAFVYNNYALTIPTISTHWNLILTNNTTGSGWIGDSASNQILSITDTRFASSNSITSVLVTGSILQFTAPSGYVFDINNNLVSNTSVLQVNQSNTLYASVINVLNSGYGNAVQSNGVNVDGSGAILLSQKIPSGALLTGILPSFIPTLPVTLLRTLIADLLSGNAISLQYNPNNVNNGFSLWSIDNTLPLNYSPAVYGTSFVTPGSIGANSTNGWILAFVPGVTTGSFTVYQRSNAYYFGSELQTTFYYDSQAKIYNPADSSTLSDIITILQINSGPGSSTNTGLPEPINIDIAGTVNEINGQIDTSRVQVTYDDFLSTGVPTNPFFFQLIVGVNNFIFLVTDNSQSTTTLISSGANQVQIVATPTFIDNNLYSYANGTIIFCTSNQSFYQISRIGSIASKTTLNNPGDTLTYSYYNGRQDLSFQYQHNASDTRRIDPSPSNIIDIYILEQSYATDYQLWVTDTTGQVPEPTPPTTETLASDFSNLENFKMISDELIFNPAQFQPLFGAKADPQLQATFVVVSNPTTSVGSGEIASQVITLVNQYFAVPNFSFGQTFYWSDLSNYIYSQLNNIISAIHLVPTAGNLSYGALEQILCSPYQIFTSAATPNDVTVVTSLNNLNLRIS